ncbi:sugar transporter SWEET1-like [Asterias rubens]|uniref:sugar transporter SWEET1-like n=1 Tax=Asterias rubens TaxID=7604 RepID=UPI001455B241|nr:sugar transporter SWEET1-like [Asterias rubens]XP_033639934.1 sugar transporter SWEET1-like [Asterias rubens]XP_033639935.1 sugar transporter SWEET1-like [Asterias rubens]
MALESRDVVSMVATISTLALFLTGIQICMKIRRQGNTNNISVFPFVASDVSCILWLKYGILRQDGTLIVVNTVGVILQSIYILIFYLNSYEKDSLHRKMLYSSLLVFPVLAYIKFYVDELDTALFQLGLICSCCSVVMYGSPLSTVAEVIRTKSTASMAFMLCLANFLVSLEWAFYGYIVMDSFIKVPNIIGALLGSIQLTLFYCYSGSPGVGHQAGGSVSTV